MARDFTPDATALFSAFAEYHRLLYTVETHAPVEVMWSFPEQPGLSLPIILGLQGDELNFGVSDFWSYFFPYEKVADQFSRAISAWVEGNARVVVTGRKGRILQVRNDDRWKSIYHANRLLPFWGRAMQIVQNELPAQP